MKKIKWKKKESSREKVVYAEMTQDPGKEREAIGSFALLFFLCMVILVLLVNSAVLVVGIFPCRQHGIGQEILVR